MRNYGTLCTWIVKVALIFTYFYQIFYDMGIFVDDGKPLLCSLPLKSFHANYRTIFVPFILRSPCFIKYEMIINKQFDNRGPQRISNVLKSTEKLRWVHSIYSRHLMKYFTQISWINSLPMDSQSYYALELLAVY